MESTISSAKRLERLLTRVAAFSISASLGWSLLHSQLVIVVAVHPKRRSLLTSGYEWIWVDMSGFQTLLELKIQTSLTTHGRQRPRLLVAIWSLVWWGFPGFLNPGSGRLFIDFIVLSDLFSGEVFKKGGRDYMTLWWSNMARNPWIFPATPMVTAGMKTCHGADDTEGYLMAQWPNYHVFPSAMAINGEILTIV